MTPSDLAKFEDERRYAIEGMANVTDELVDLHDRIMIKLFSAAKNKHQQDFQKQGKAISGGKTGRSMKVNIGRCGTLRIANRA